MQRCVYLHILLQVTFLGEGLLQTAWNLRIENVRLLYQGDMGCPRKQGGGFCYCEVPTIAPVNETKTFQHILVANRDFTKMTLVGQRKLCRN